MGIDITGLRALNFVRRAWSVDFTRTVMLGRQEIFFTKADFLYVGAKSDLRLEYDSSIEAGQFAEPLLIKFGAQKVDSIDASAYEGASIVADFNHPIADELRGEFSLFIDCGTIEHIYNIPEVVANVSRLLRKTGISLILTNADGFTGHGFYQFSPEFFYSVFSDRNGFRDTAVFLIDLQQLREWIYVPDPRLLGGRNVIPPGRSYYIVCVSAKQADVSDFSVQQSDYQELSWAKSGHRHSGASGHRSFRSARQIVGSYLFQNLRHRYHVHKARRKFRSTVVRFDPDTIPRTRFDEFRGATPFGKK